MKDRMNMDVKRAEPDFRCEIEQAAIDWATGRMHQNIHRSQLRFRFAHATSSFICLAAVGQNQFAAPAKGFDCIACLGGVSVQTASHDGDIRTVLGQGNGRGTANAPGASSDQSYFVGKIHTAVS